MPYCQRRSGMRQDRARLCPLTTHHDVTARNDVVLQSDWTATIVAERTGQSHLTISSACVGRLRQTNWAGDTSLPHAHLAHAISCKFRVARRGATPTLARGSGCKPILFSVYLDGLLQKLADSGVGCHWGHFVCWCCVLC